MRTIRIASIVAAGIGCIGVCAHAAGPFLQFEVKACEGQKFRGSTTQWADPAANPPSDIKGTAMETLPPPDYARFLAVVTFRIASADKDGVVLKGEWKQKMEDKDQPLDPVRLTYGVPAKVQVIGMQQRRITFIVISHPDATAPRTSGPSTCE